MKSHIRRSIFAFAAAITLAGALSISSLANLTDNDPDTGMTVSVSDISRAVTEGEKITADVSINGSPDINSLDLEVEYDSGVLSYSGISWSGALGDEDLSIHDNGGGVLVLSIDSDSGFSMSGVLATITFEAIGNANPAPSPSIMIRSFTSLGDDDTDYSDDDSEDTEETGDTNDTAEEDSSKSSSDDKKSNEKSSSDKIKGNNGGSSTSSSGMAPSRTRVSTSTSRRADSSYKTGVGLGNNIFLVIGAAAGFLAAIAGLLGRQKRK